jgi:hypothetical protein
MTMSRLKSVAAAAALLVAGSAAQAVVLVSEGFEDRNTLTPAGWVITNNGTPTGTTIPWYQGDQNIFTAQSGSANSYLASNYNNAAAGGYINSVIATPVFATDFATTVTFSARADIAPGYFDFLSWGFSSGSSTQGLFTAVGSTVATGAWTQYTATLAAQPSGSTGRFVIVYSGPADFANYVGIDTLTVSNTALVPEPTSWLMLGAGLMGLSILRRRTAAQR